MWERRREGKREVLREEGEKRRNVRRKEGERKRKKRNRMKWKEGGEFNHDDSEEEKFQFIQKELKRN